MLESERLALTSTPSIAPSDADETVPASASACAAAGATWRIESKAAAVAAASMDVTRIGQAPTGLAELRPPRASSRPWRCECRAILAPCPACLQRDYTYFESQI